MAAGSRLMTDEPSMGKAQTVAREIICYARKRAEANAVGKVAGAVLGCSRFARRRLRRRD